MADEDKQIQVAERQDSEDRSVPEGKSDRYDVLAANVATYLDEEDCAEVAHAYEFARRAHEGQFRKSGEPFIMHPVEAAIILSELKMDADTVAAAVLHDTVEDTDVTLDDLRENFNDTVAELVDGVTKINQIEVESLSEKQVNNLRKMLVAMSRDIRVIVIKLADRLHNMRTLMALKEDRRIFKAKETMEIYAPLANRLGMGSIKWELEDLSFFYLEPAKYQQVQKMVNETREEREAYLNEAMTALRAELDRVGLTEAKISGRPKHLYSIYQKMMKKDKDFSEIYDLIGLRVIVDTIPECYSTLGAVHNLWHPIPGRFKDYIAMPKFNMYQSLHTTVMGPAARPLEIQIRTEEMHRMNEYGVAAHWRYKEGGSSKGSNRDFDQKLTWLREMLDWQQETEDPHEFMESLKVDLFENEVFCFTPKGEVISLRAESTPLDFAYAIHTEVGNHCVGAKVNGAIVPLTRTLQTGDRVEILTQKNAKPSRDWLNIVRSPRARSKIRAYFSKVTRNDDIERGRDLVIKEVRKDGLSIAASKLTPVMEKVAVELGFSNTDEMLVTVGGGKFSPKQVSHHILRALNQDSATGQGTAPVIGQFGLQGSSTIPATEHRKRPRNAHNKTGVVVKGIDDVYVRLSRCCNPLPGDDIIGFITRGRGVSVHRADCPNAADLKKNPERMIEVSWESDIESSYQVEIYIEAIDRLRLLQDIVMTLADQGVNILSSSTTTHKDDIVEMHFLFEVSETDRIEDILKSLKGIEGVFDATRKLPGEQAANKKRKKKQQRKQQAKQEMQQRAK
jgi:guanosine-3',5'-bis(diphosphate) 3'-pyrophosphohydrolase